MWRGASSRLYPLAIVFAVLSCALDAFSGRRVEHWTLAGYSISGALFVAGFLVWIAPQLKLAWQSPAGRFLLTAAHATILFLAIPIARDFAAEALGLPPQDFDLTVAVLTLELYPSLWVLACAFAMLLMFAGLLALSCISSLASWPLLIRAYLFVIRAPADQSWQAVSRRQNRFVTRTAFHAFGAALIASGAAVLWDWHTRFLMSHPDLIRWVAYFVDYHRAPLYPSIDIHARLRLHENGVVSYAVPRDGGVRIIVKRMDQ
jgi:hypothetical protein